MTIQLEAISFETAKSGTEPEIEALYRTAFGPYVRQLGRELSADAYRWLPESVAQGKVWVALYEAEMIGVVAISIDDDSWLIDDIAVAPELQGDGIGSWMLQRVEQLARARGIAKLTLNTAKMMTDLLRLYRRHGFYAAREGPPTHGKDNHPRVYMEKLLQ